jgi:hypothetical protein
MRKVLALAIVATVGLAAANEAQAMAAFGVPQTDGSSIQLVSGGCGPGGFRDRFGYCRPRGYYPPPPRRCPPYTHPTPYGCRRNY